VPFFCYIHRDGSGVPYFEVLPELTQRGARERAAQLLAQRADAIRAEVWDGDTLVFTVPRTAAEPAAASG
jgi:hypothetical protein